jgi:hypothetical protein
MTSTRRQVTLAAGLYYGRLIIPALLFGGWLGWLAYLAATKTNPVVVSRSQIMAADRFVVAEVTLNSQGFPNKTVTVLDDLRPTGPPLSGTISVENIEKGRVAGAKEFREGTRYLLPLSVSGTGGYVLTVQPRSPGQEFVDPDKLRPWAYRWDDPEVQRQFNALVPKR